MTRNPAIVFMLAILEAGISLSAASQTSAELKDYLRDSIGLSQGQLADIQNGKAVAKVLKSRTPAEIFVFGAVYIKATPESYVQLAGDFDRLRKLPEFLAIGKFSDPPRATDLEGFNFDSDDIKSLKECKPSDCEVQMPAEGIENIHKSINWSAPPAELDRQVNQQLHQRVIEGLQAYRRHGNRALGFYVDKGNPTDVPQQFEYMLSYAKALPKYLPDFQRYLLAYPNAKSENMSDMFYWAKVKFGLKPTLRVVQVVTLRGTSANEAAYAIAEKQLYSSHYFETALDLTFCVRGTDDPKQPGFYLIKTMGSEQAGLTGVKGTMVRKVAVGRSASSLENVDTRMEAIGGTVFRRALSEVKEQVHEENVAAMKADLAQLKAEHAKAHADRKAKLQEKINQLDSKIQAQLQNAKDRRDALQRKAQAKVQVLKDKAAEARAKAS